MEKCKVSGCGDPRVSWGTSRISHDGYCSVRCREHAETRRDAFKEAVKILRGVYPDALGIASAITFLDARARWE